MCQSVGGTRRIWNIHGGVRADCTEFSNDANCTVHNGHTAPSSSNHLLYRSFSLSLSLSSLPPGGGNRTFEPLNNFPRGDRSFIPSLLLQQRSKQLAFFLFPVSRPFQPIENRSNRLEESRGCEKRSIWV